MPPRILICVLALASALASCDRVAEPQPGERPAPTPVALRYLDDLLECIAGEDPPRRADFERDPGRSEVEAVAACDAVPPAHPTCCRQAKVGPFRPPPEPPVPEPPTPAPLAP